MSTILTMSHSLGDEAIIVSNEGLKMGAEVVEWHNYLNKLLLLRR